MLSVMKIDAQFILAPNYIFFFLHANYCSEYLTMLKQQFVVNWPKNLKKHLTAANQLCVKASEFSLESLDNHDQRYL